MEDNIQTKAPITISLGFIFLMFVAWLLSFLINTFFYTISFFETYGIMMLGLALTVVLREFLKKDS